MNKKEFSAKLREALLGLPQKDIDERLAFYGEMIDDRVEEGKSESEAIAELGPIETIVSQILAETPMAKIVKEKMVPKRKIKAWEILLIVLGFPLWFPLLIAAGAILFSLYVVVWSLLLSLWAVEFSFAVSALAGVVGSLVGIARGSGFLGLAGLGTGLFFAGVSILLFFGCVAASKGLVKVTKKVALAIKFRLIKKETSK